MLQVILGLLDLLQHSCLLLPQQEYLSLCLYDGQQVGLTIILPLIQHSIRDHLSISHFHLPSLLLQVIYVQSTLHLLLGQLLVYLVLVLGETGQGLGAVEAIIEGGLTLDVSEYVL